MHSVHYLQRATWCFGISRKSYFENTRLQWIPQNNGKLLVGSGHSRNNLDPSIVEWVWRTPHRAIEESNDIDQPHSHRCRSRSQPCLLNQRKQKENDAQLIDWYKLQKFPIAHILRRCFESEQVIKHSTDDNEIVFRITNIAAMSLIAICCASKKGGSCKTVCESRQLVTKNGEAVVRPNWHKGKHQQAANVHSVKSDDAHRVLKPNHKSIQQRAQFQAPAHFYHPRYKRSSNAPSRILISLLTFAEATAKGLSVDQIAWH